jgi:hypothetical protein
MLLPRLFADLRSEGSEATISPELGGIAIARYRDTCFSLPLVLEIDEQLLTEHLQDSIADGLDVFPDLPGLEGAYRLFLVHLDEAILTRKQQEVRFIVSRVGIVPQSFRS